MSRIPTIVIAKLNSSNCKVGDKFRIFHPIWNSEGHVITIEEVGATFAVCSGNTPNHCYDKNLFRVSGWGNAVLGYSLSRRVGVFKKEVNDV